jgi:hypothetical protein
VTGVQTCALPIFSQVTLSLSPFGTSATIWPIVPAPDDR